MKNKKGFIPLFIPIIIFTLGIGATITYQNSKTVQKAVPVSQFFKQNDLERNKNKPTSQNQEHNTNQNTKIEQNKDSSCQNTGLESIKISEAMANDFLNTKVPSYDYAGYSINGGNVKFTNNAINVNIEASNGANLSAVVVPTGNGKSFTINNVQSPDNSFSSVQLVGIKLMLSRANSLIWNYIPSEYAKQFSHFTVNDGEIVIFLYANNSNCSNEE
jgi:hypothetical protein